MMIVWSVFGAAPVPSMTRTWVSATAFVSTATNGRTAFASVGRWAAAVCAIRPTASTPMDHRAMCQFPIV